MGAQLARTRLVLTCRTRQDQRMVRLRSVVGRVSIQVALILGGCWVLSGILLAAGQDAWGIAGLAVSASLSVYAALFLLPEGKASKHRGSLRNLGWIVLALVVIGPIYLLGAAVAIRSHAFAITSQRPMTSADVRAVWGFLGASLAVSVTAMGLLFTRDHNQRTLTFQKESEENRKRAQEDSDKRLELDTAVESLKLLGTGAQYSTKASVAGALTTLVQLRQPIIALRCLAAAWEGPAVDTATAVWLIDRCYENGSPQEQIEAVYLLSAHISALTREDRPGHYEVPASMMDRWVPEADWNAKVEVLSAACELLMSRKRNWWRGSVGWVIVLFDEVCQTDTDADVRNSAASVNRVLLEVLNPDDSYPFAGTWRTVAEITERANAAEAVDESETVTSIDALLDRLREWRDAKDMQPDAVQVSAGAGDVRPRPLEVAWRPPRLPVSRVT
jgi:hypothetical protein